MALYSSRHAVRPDSSHADFDAPAARHSALGVESFIIALVIFVMDAGLFVVGMAGVDEDRLVGPFAVLAICATIVLSSIGLVQGFRGLTDPQGKKVFAVVGTVMNGLVIAGWMIGLVWISCVFKPIV